MTPLKCLVSDWIDSFKRPGWSKCAGKNLFITGLYRVNPPDNTSDPIPLLEQARCCSIPEFSDQDGTCKNADWRNSLNKCVFITHRSFHRCPCMITGVAWMNALQIFTKYLCRMPQKGAFRK